MKRRWLLLVLALLVALLPLALAAAQADFGLSWWSVDSAGGQSGGGDFSLQAVAGQPDAGLLQAGNFSLAGGYLGGAPAAPAPQRRLFLPLASRP